MYTAFKATRKPIAKVKINEIPNLNQFTVEAYAIINGIVSLNPLTKTFKIK